MTGAEEKPEDPALIHASRRRRIERLLDAATGVEHGSKGSDEWRLAKATNLRVKAICVTLGLRTEDEVE